MYLHQSKQKRADGSMLSHLQITENTRNPVKKRSRVNHNKHASNSEIGGACGLDPYGRHKPEIHVQSLLIALLTGFPIDWETVSVSP